MSVDYRRYNAPYGEGNHDPKFRDKAYKNAKKHRGEIVPEKIELAIIPNFYFSQGKWMFVFTKHTYSRTENLLPNIQKLKKVEAMLTLYYAKKYLASLKADPTDTQSIEDSKVYDKELNRWELDLTMHKTNSNPSKELDLFVNQMVNSIRMLIEQLDMYSTVMSEHNQKVAKIYKSELNKQLNRITSKEFDLTPFHKLAQPSLYEEVQETTTVSQ